MSVLRLSLNQNNSVGLCSKETSPLGSDQTFRDLFWSTLFFRIVNFELNYFVNEKFGRHHQRE